IWNESQSAKEIIESFIMSGKKQEETAGAWEKRRLQSLAEKFKDLSISQIMLEIKKATTSGASQSDLATLTHTLRDFLELYPEEASSVPRLLKERKLTGKAAGSVLLALEMIGHAEAQTALKDVFEDDDQISDNRLRAIVAAGGIAKPEKELIESLFDLAKAGREGGSDEELERSDTSLLNLGILSYSLSKGEEPSESNAINERIVTSLENSEDERERVMCLKALGNTSSSDIISVVESYLTSESPEERAASAGSLRNFSDEHTLELLVNSMEDDPEPGVRKAAISALSDRGGIDVVAPVCKHLPDEPDEYLRGMMVRLLGKNKTPEVIDTLKKQIEVETSSEVAKEIYRVLYGK
ncbi:HEAT repeat domain-containing protein, partial [Desulfobacterales bacterium HSG2]|nr:HEAT repeat domain-containing protein [Desulfobacterales bacterium HSG2]